MKLLKCTCPRCSGNLYEAPALELRHEVEISCLHCGEIRWVRRKVKVSLTPPPKPPEDFDDDKEPFDWSGLRADLMPPKTHSGIILPGTTCGKGSSRTKSAGKPKKPRPKGYLNHPFFET